MTGASRIVTDLIANDAQYQQAISRAIHSNMDYQRSVNKDVVAANKKMDSSFKTAVNTLNGPVRDAANNAIQSIATIGAATATALAGMYTVTAQSIDEQAKFADRIGITTEALAGLQYAGELTGVSADRMTDSLQGMVERVSEATTGTGEAAEALNNLGLSAQALNLLAPEQQFLAIAKAMGEVEKRADQVRYAIQIFEGEGAALLNTLDAGAEGINSMMTEAQNLGIALSRIDAAKVEQANDAFYRSSQTAKGFAQSLTVELAPIVQGVSAELVNAANAAGGFGEVSTEIVNKLATGFGFVGDIIRGWEAIFAGIGQLWTETVYAVVHDITYLDQVMTDLANKIPGINAEYNQTLQTMTRELSAEMLKGREELHNLLMQPLPSETIELYVHQWREVSRVQAEATATLKTYSQETLDTAQAVVEQQEVIQRNAAQSMLDKVTGDIDTTNKMFEGFASGMSSALANAALSGELSFGRLAESIISDMMRIYIQAQIVQPLMEMMGFTFGAPKAKTPTVTPGVNHTGGIAGIADAGSRSVPLSTFAGAPRFHTGGIIGSEVPIIAQRGEGVFTPEQMKRLSPVGNSPAKVSIQIINNGQPAEVERTEQSQNGDMTQIKMWIRDVVNSDLNSGQGIDRTLRTQYPSLARRGYG